jgi:hypothetical protein
MTSHAFSAFIEVESSPSSSHPEAHAIPIAPQKAFERTYHSVPLPQGPNAIELENLQWGTKRNGPNGESGYYTPPGTQTPMVTDLEMSRPATPQDNEQDGVDTVQSFSNPPMNRFRMLAVSLLNFGNGLNDSAPGALIPYIEKSVPQIHLLLFVTYFPHLDITILDTLSSPSSSSQTRSDSFQQHFVLKLYEHVLDEQEHSLFPNPSFLPDTL